MSNLLTRIVAAAALFVAALVAAGFTQNFTITVTISTPIFSCTGFSPSGSAVTGLCGVRFPGSTFGTTFQMVGATAGSTPCVGVPCGTGTQLNLVPTSSTHNANNVNYELAAVNIAQFTSTFTFVPDGQNISFVLSNHVDTGINSAGNAVNGGFTAGAGCEGSFWQGTPGYPNNTFAIMIDSYGGNSAGSGTHTYDNVQYYVTGTDPPNAPNGPGRDPCNPDQGGTNSGLPWTYIGVNKLSTSPVALNSPAGTQNTTTGHTYSATVTYDGSNLTFSMFDITAGGACPGAQCFTTTWNSVNIPAIVGSSTAWVGLAGSTGLPNDVGPLLINAWSFSN